MRRALEQRVIASGHSETPSSGLNQTLRQLSRDGTHTSSLGVLGIRGSLKHEEQMSAEAFWKHVRETGKLPCAGC
jgi:hypothetical protein